jgi:beta-lactamase class A
MMILQSLLLGALALTADDSLRARVESRIAQVPGARVAVAFRELDGGDSLVLRGDDVYHAASTMKVPVLIELFRRVDAGSLALDQPVLLVNQFGSIVDGSPFTVDPADDSDSSLYARVGERVPLGELAERMIDRSSNLATNTVIGLLGAEQVTATMRSLGAGRLVVLRGVEDGKAFRRGLNNEVTAADLATVMAAIATGRAASARSCDAMREILLRQEFNTQIPAGLPAGTPVAHKTGWITGIRHDAAIVYPRDRAPYVLVVLTGNIAEPATADALMRDISRLVYEHAMNREAIKGR